jgi:hypothetical protein
MHRFHPAFPLAVLGLVLALTVRATEPVGTAINPPIIDLTTAKSIALERQPAIAAARASLSASLQRKQSLDNLRIPTFLQRDLPIRRKQSSLGPIAAQAGVHLAELNTHYAVQYAYVAYLYARTQEKVATRSIRRLRQLEDVLKKILEPEKDKAPDVDAEPIFFPADRERIQAMIHFASGKRDEAILGGRRALSALREALAIEDCSLGLAHDRLLVVDLDLDAKALVALALKHRPEIIQASIAEKVYELEVAAQQARKQSLSVRTFASGSDLHVQPLPAGSFEGDYKPSAVGPEMPISINGRVCDRVIQATIYHDRSQAVVEKVRQLIRLDIEQSILRYEEARAKLRKFEEGSKLAEKATRGLRDKLSLDRNARPRLESLLNTALIGSQLRVQANEARFQMLVALIGIERATAGAFSAGLERAPQLADEKPDPDEDKE